VRFETKNNFLHIEKHSSALQRWRCSCNIKSRCNRKKPQPVMHKNSLTAGLQENGQFISPKTIIITLTPGAVSRLFENLGCLEANKPNNLPQTAVCYIGTPPTQTPGSELWSVRPGSGSGFY
jgi:hypothetical protein